MEKENQFLKPPKTKTLLWILCSILVVLISFGMGIVIGYRRAIFAENWNQNYYHNFYGLPGGIMIGMGPAQPPPFNPHGVVGEIIDIGSSTISVKDSDGDEQSIFVATDTPIREMNNTVSLAAIKIGDQVTIIGEPNDNGQVEARFIRVISASTSSE